MSKSIFYRYFLMVQSVLLLAMLFIAIFSFSFFGHYVTDTQSAFLMERAERLAEMTELVLRSPDESALGFLEFNMTTISSSSDCNVTILNSEGNVYKEVLAATSGFSAAELDESILSHVLSGKPYSYVGRLPGGRIPTMVLSSPVLYRGEPLGAAVITIPVPSLQSARKELMVTMVWVYLISMVLASIASFFMARFVTRPLRQLSRAAQEIGKGNFDMRVREDSHGELLELARTFNRMTESLQHLEEMRTSFISNVSHELRTPMTTISGFIEGILDGTVPPEKEKEYLSIALSESRRLSSLVTNLLQTSRVEQETELKTAPFDLTESMRIGIIQFDPQITEKDLTVSANFETDHMMALGNADMIRQVITNLLDNAVKFTPAGGKITVDMHRKGDRIYTAVTNTGDGIAPEDLPLIWDRFYKTDRSRSKDKSGVGLGLHLVRTILKKHGETIEAESKEGEYTRFTFTLKSAEE